MSSCCLHVYIYLNNLSDVEAHSLDDLDLADLISELWRQRPMHIFSLHQDADADDFLVRSLTLHEKAGFGVTAFC